MFIEIDNRQYMIHLKSDVLQIDVIKIQDDIIHLSVPVDFPQESLVFFIKRQLRKRIINKHHSNSAIDITSIHIFGKNYPIKVIDSVIPYLHNNIIHASIKYLSNKKNILILKEKLLYNHLNNLFSNIEEDTDTILPDLFIRQMKTNYYAICHNKKSITFSKKLIDKPLSFNTYIVVLGMAKYLKFTQEEADTIIRKYVSDWKHCERILQYEQ